MMCNTELCPNCFSVNVSVLALVFRQQILKNDNLRQNCWFFENCQWNTTASMETFTENN